MPSLMLSKNDLDVFSDLGSHVQFSSNMYSLVRNGVLINIEARDDGYIVTTTDGDRKFHWNAGSLLSDPLFGNLERIARNQTILLKNQQIIGAPVPVNYNISSIIGNFSDFPKCPAPWKALDEWLREQKESQNASGTDLLLIDGPAGVGKTTIVREAALIRAENYDGSASLILQISSRGRVLQNIGDLIAFSLQDVRSNLTVGQLVSLMRHGLVILAIDGFDELSDPNGFETAWSGLNSLVNDIRGSASVLLAGRETFVSTEIIKRQLKSSLKEEVDRLASLSIRDPDPAAAQNWLLRQPGWSYELISREFVEPLFVEGSYALRPFFLDLIAREPDAMASDEPPASDLLTYLVETMVQRESRKFVEEFDPPDSSGASTLYKEYVYRFLEEVARDLAENQAESVNEDALDLIATVAAEGIIPNDQVNAIVRRARTMVFLANDIRFGHIRFAHEQLAQHFLSREALRSVGRGELPRYIRRNVFSRESLDVFAHVARGHEDVAFRFLANVRSSLTHPQRDRTSSNLAILGVSAVCALAPDDADLKIQGVTINEMHFPFAAPYGIAISDTTISVLHAAESDIRAVVFDETVSIVTLETDRGTRLPESMPVPMIIVNSGRTISNQREILEFLSPVVGRLAQEEIEWPEDVRELLSRIENYRAFWLRTSIDEADRQGRRIIAHPKWADVYDALKRLDFVTVKYKAASGIRTEFIHFRQNVNILESRELFQHLIEK
ncbi:MAG: NACHT domain-containing protein [Beijerinckiaceae bacterium]|jgi:hypothetical protein|nr:NACHT domain-containing protein [Beijerinckiaceae bacterium]